MSTKVFKFLWQMSYWIQNTKESNINEIKKNNKKPIIYLLNKNHHNFYLIKKLE